ncbi:MAG: hypothetical protein PHQ58_03965 [Rhodoferax sp.]|uniref:hypothetical protein n=1 Tax=Rhodoferax sp. TaxID=50421 RepID=UPI00260CCF7C|nr:hypothetical protein [Rhodoferax sp.]MDD2879570.1 hypothetical protein [Rhodoferax sp.]
MFNRIDPANLPLGEQAEDAEIQVAFSHTSDQALEQSPAPMHAVEVLEVDDDTAWALWEDSVAFQDSLFAPAAEFGTTLQTRLDLPEGSAEFVDAFASVHKKSR